MKQPAKRSINRICRSVAPSSIAPPSEVIEPPSNAATTFRPSTGAKPNRSALHSVCIGFPLLPRQTVLATRFSQIQGPDAPTPFEISGLVPHPDNAKGCPLGDFSGRYHQLDFTTVAERRRTPSSNGERSM